MMFTILILTPLVSGGLLHQPYPSLLDQYRQHSVNYQTQPLVKYSPTGNIIEQTRTQANSLKQTTKGLSTNPIAAKYINRLISNSACLNSLEDALQAIESGTQMVENAGPEILALIQTVQGMQNKKDNVLLVKDSANLLRQLEVLIPKLAPAYPNVCQERPAETFDALRNVARLLLDVARDEQIHLSYDTKHELKRSAEVINGVTAFVTQLRESFSLLQQSCTADKQYNIEAINAIGDTMDNLANLFGVLGGFEDGKAIRKQGSFAKRVVVAINNVRDLDLGTLNCNSPGSFRVAAQTLDDLANIIADVGIEKLSEQIGINVFEI